MKKQCPFCSEEIISTAIKCKHCGEYFGVTNTQKIKPVKAKAESKKIYEIYPELANCRFCDPPPTYKQFAYVLHLGINPDKLNVESISNAIDSAKHKGTSATRYIKEQHKEALYEYIYNKERVKPKFSESHPSCTGCLIIIIIIIIAVIAMIIIFSTCDNSGNKNKKIENTKEYTQAKQARAIAKASAKRARAAQKTTKPVAPKPHISKFANVPDIIFDNQVRVCEAVDKLVKQAYSPRYIRTADWVLPQKVKGYKDRWIITTNFHSETKTGRYIERKLKVTIDFTKKGKPRLLYLKDLNFKTGKINKADIK